MTAQRSCYIDCPHQVGECLAAHRTHRAWRARRDQMQSAARLLQLEREAHRERVAQLRPFRSVIRFLRWPSRKPKTADEIAPPYHEGGDGQGIEPGVYDVAES